MGQLIQDQVGNRDYALKFLQTCFIFIEIYKYVSPDFCFFWIYIIHLLKLLRCE